MRPIASIVALAFSVVSCAASQGPVTVPADQLPFPLARTEEAQATPGSEQVYEIGFVRRKRLVMIERTLTPEATGPEAAMRSLLAGPNERERERGLETAIPPATRLLLVTVFDQIAEVDLSSEFQEPAPSERTILRVAQVVWTLIAIEGITAVRFVIEGVPVSVPIGDGRIVERPVTAPDYASVRPDR